MPNKEGMTMKKTYEKPFVCTAVLDPADILTDSSLTAGSFTSFDRINFNELI